MDSSPFHAEVWRPALEKYGSVTRLTVILFGSQGQIVCGPINRTTLFDTVAGGTSDLGLFTECATRCLRQDTRGSAVSVIKRSGLAVVGTPFALNERIEEPRSPAIISSTSPRLPQSSAPLPMPAFRSLTCGMSSDRKRL